MRVLLAGESWVVHSTHLKGFDSFTTTTYTEGAHGFIDALTRRGITVDYQPCHVAATAFPSNPEALSRYDAVILSDIGSNTLLLHDDTFVRGKRKPNALVALKDYVAAGGGFAMMGGYLSFQGIDAKARYAGTAVEEILPVSLMSCDDRRETPEGIVPTVEVREHPILAGVEGPWPHFLGYNMLLKKSGAEVLATCGDHVFMAAGSYGKGRTFAFASDIAPHWGSPEFVQWAGYEVLFANAVRWLANR